MRNIGKLEKTVTKATYGVVGILMAPLYEQMRKERKEELKRERDSWKRADEDAMVEAMQPRRFEVHQPIDAIIHVRSIW
jgi:hypothetical protein